jgi:tetratricopeptide (TPR) repeat protein
MLPFPLDADRLVFLVGSGVSVASGLPTGWEFNTGIAEFFGASSAERGVIASLLVAGYGHSAAAVRFEQVMFVLRERLDPNLDVLTLFGGTGPGALHQFLAREIAAGAIVFTTNFDGLIERACKDAGLDAQLVYVEDAADEPSPNTSFQRVVLGSSPVVLKLHGTIEDGKASAPDLVRRHIGATLDRIGARGRAAKLEPHKYRALSTALAGRVLCVLGYSGSDDFDILPSLAELLPRAAGLLWFRHEPRAPSVSTAVDLLPAALRTAASRGPSVIVTGDTLSGVASYFGVTLPVVQAAPRERVPDWLARLPAYASATGALKKLVAARLGEEAMRPDLSDAWYQDAATLALRRDSTTYAYALFRRGHLARERDIQASLGLLRRSERIFRRIGDDRNLPLVLNAIGNVFLLRGPLRLATKYYHDALGITRKIGSRRFEATLLNNLGLVEKHRGAFAKAIDWYDQAAVIDADIRDRVGLSRDLGNKATALLLLERHDEALALFEECIALDESLGRHDSVAVWLVNRGVVYRRLGRLDDARQAARDALKLEQALNRKHGIACCLSLFGTIAMVEKNWPEAVAKLKEAIAYDEAIHHVEGPANDYESLGDAYAALGDRDVARAAYEKSIKHHRLLGNLTRVVALEQRLRTF